MSLFLDYEVELPDKEQYICTAWSNTETILAVGMKNQQVIFFQEEGKRFKKSFHARKADIVSMEWQPNGKILAIGWSDGTLSTWNSKTSTAKEIRSPYSPKECKIISLTWSPYGNRLISADEKGLITILKIDIRGNASVCMQYRKSGRITHFSFCTTAQQRERLLRNFSFSQSICPTFFFGGENGTIYHADDLGHSSEIQQLNSSIKSMLFYEEKSKLIIITQSLLLVQLQVSEEGDVRPIMKVKLSFAAEAVISNVLWTGPGLMAAASNEPLIRVWDFKKGENYVLSIASTSLDINKNDRITSIAFNPRNLILAAATKDGHVIFWKFHPSIREKTNTSGQKSWEPLSFVRLPGNIKQIQCGPLEGFFSIQMIDMVSAYILNQSKVHRSICNDVAVIQSSQTCLSVERYSRDFIGQCIIDCNIKIKNLVHDGRLIVVFNGERSEVYEFNNSKAKLVGEFISEEAPMGLSGETFYRFHEYAMESCNLRGNVKNSVTFTEGEGKPIILDATDHYVAIGTEKGIIKVFDISRREPKLIGTPGKLNDSGISELSNIQVEIQSIKCNSNGTNVSILLDSIDGSLGTRSPSSFLLVFNTEKCTFSTYDFGRNRYPISHFWDQSEPRILVCESYNSHIVEEETSKNPAVDNDEDNSKQNNLASGSLKFKNTSTSSEKEVTSFFATLESGIQIQDTFELDEKYRCILGIHAPYLFFATSKAEKDVDQPQPMLRYQVMRDFVGLDQVDNEAKAALVNFSYYITIGNMDEAYRSVKLIQNSSVWENMAHMCVKTKRLDVAIVCLGNMGHARGAQAIKECEDIEEEEAKIAMVAIQLGLLDDAVRLYKECKRYDLLIALYRSSGYWDKAITTAAQNDRIHLKNTHFLYAQHLESLGDFKKAIKQYELSGLHHVHVPRMLHSNNKMHDLENYIKNKDESKLFLWYAQFLESKEDYKKAIKFYKRGKDILSIVRIYCTLQDYNAAVDVVQVTESKIGAYHLARQFEAADDIQNAIAFYAKAQCYSNSLRLAKDNGLDSELMSFALLSPRNQMLETAQYFEDKGEYSKAVQLYRRGKDLTRAIDACFRSELYEELQLIADEMSLSEKANPRIIQRCADFFYENKQYDKAIHLFLKGGRYEEALNLCVNNNIQITEEMAEEMTLTKSDEPSVNERRLKLLKMLAKACRQQGSYHLATKKYTQAGDKLKAMKCLLKSGDTEKVIFFAGVSRNKEIYILAANYLQNLDWRNNSDIFKSITNFYAKAKAFEQLSTFYDVWGQIEIDEAQNYAKAIIALKEAAKFIAKSKSDRKNKNIEIFKRRISLMEEFNSIKNIKDESLMISKLEELLNNSDTEIAIRLGDIYSILINYYYENDNFGKTYDYIEKLKERRIDPRDYIDHKILKQILKKYGQNNDISDNKGNINNIIKSENQRFHDNGNNSDDEIDEDIDWDGHEPINVDYKE